jgi:anaerobic ribonucleoside-triphosphate reductase activating protein
MTIAGTRSLGPYNRFAIWVQGCPRQCPGCVSKDSQPADGGYDADTADLAEAVINTPSIEGITISGGEPFLQSEALTDLVARIKSKRDTGVIVYTGFDFDVIRENELTKLCDIVIDGAYIEELNDGLSLRGSSNQNVCLVTERYASEAKSLYGAQGRKIELHVMEGRTTMVGIPDNKELGGAFEEIAVSKSKNGDINNSAFHHNSARAKNFSMKKYTCELLIHRRRLNQ